MSWIIIGALIIGLSLGMLGSGGSILTVPILIYLMGQPEKLAIASALAIVGGISLIAAIPYYLKKEIQLRSIIGFGIPSVIGTFLGALLAHYISGTIQLTLFSIIMCIAAWRMLRGSPTVLENKQEITRLPMFPLISVGLGVGMMTGIVGVGGGFLIIPALTLLLFLPMRTAVGTSLLIIAANSAIGFITYYSQLKTFNLVIDWNVILSFIIIGGIGSLLGSKMSQYLPQHQLKKVFGILLIIMASYIIIKQTPQLFNAHAQEKSIMTTSSVHSIKNWHSVGNAIYTAGQPTAEQWQIIKSQGITDIINLRPDSEQPDANEAAQVKQHGLNYYYLPISGGADLTPENVQKFRELLSKQRDGGVLIHCASANRAGALFALSQFIDNNDPHSAIEYGKKAGLTGLEPVVLELIQEKSK